MILTVEQACAKVIARCRRLGPTEVPVLEALGRVLADDVRSDIDISPFDNSAMDGYAVRAADTAAAASGSPVTLAVLAHIAAGDFSATPLGPGETARIMTGAPLPPGADAVVMIEHAEAGERGGFVGGTVRIGGPVEAGEHVRRRGEEVAAGAVVLAAGDVVGPAAVGLLAATGHTMVRVHGRPRVAVIATGDELVEADEKPGPGKIRNSNSYSLCAQVLAAGGMPLRQPILRDDPAAMRAALRRAAAEADFIVTSGGVSVGDFDHIKELLAEIGELDFTRVAMRPGQWQSCGAIDGVPFCGLPGNPTSTFVGFEILVRPALRLMQGHRHLERPRLRAVLDHDITKHPQRRYFFRATVTRAAGGELRAGLAGNQSSALLTAAHRANCLLILPEGKECFTAGAAVEIMRLDQEAGTA